MDPLTIDQLKSLGFDIAYKKRKGAQVFDYALYRDWQIGDLMGSFYELPTFHQILERAVEMATQREKQRIKEKLTQQMLD